MKSIRPILLAAASVLFAVGEPTAALSGPREEPNDWAKADAAMAD